MTVVQKLQLRQSELRSLIASELEKGEDKDHTVLDKTTSEMQGLEIELRAAITIESVATPEDRVEDSEGRELAEIRNSLDFGNYVGAALTGGGRITGAEAEYNKHLNIREDFFPLDMLVGSAGLETRAIIAGDAQTSQSTLG